jgi:hypothetical protein
MLLCNLAQMQKNYVTWQDYCQETYIHGIEGVGLVLWLSNLRQLGYNGRTIQRDLVRLLLAITVRKGCALILVYEHPGKHDETIEIALHMFNSFIQSGTAKYRPEHFVLCSFCIHLSELLLVTSKLKTVSLLPLSFIIFCFLTSLWDSLHRVVFGRKITKEMSRFRDAWLECKERNPEVVTELAKLCKGITVRLDKQREEALQLSWWTHGLQMYWWTPWGRAQAFLDERVGRWSLLCKGKARQGITNLDLLMAQAGVINEKFLNLVSEIGFNGYCANRSAGLEFVAGPVKQPTRTLQKLVRRYRRDVGCLTDFVRCTIIAESLEDVKDFLQLLYSFSVVGLDSEAPEQGKDSRQRLGEQLELSDQIFRITALENRFDASYNDEKSMGYRDLALNVEVGWLINNGFVSFQKVRDWRRLNCSTHICEIQIRTRLIHECAEVGQQEYITLRNALSR